MMKQMLIILSISLLSNISFAQTKTNTAITQGDEKLQKSIQTHAFVFQLPSTITKEKLDATIKRYESYLDIKQQDNHTITIQLKPRNEAKVIMLRFFKDLFISYVDVDGKTMDLMTFNKQYLTKIKRK